MKISVCGSNVSRNNFSVRKGFISSVFRNSVKTSAIKIKSVRNSSAKISYA